MLFRNLPEGEFRISLRGSKLSTVMTVHVPSREAVHFKPRQANALGVPRGAGSTHGFYPPGLIEGDLIVGMNGAEFGSQVLMDNLLTLHLLNDHVTLLVERNGSRREVKVDSRLWMQMGLTDLLDPVSR